MSIEIGLVLFLALEGTALYFAYLAVRYARTPQGSVAWAVFLLAAPYFAVPAFLFLGSFKFRGFLSSRRHSDEIVQGLKTVKDVYPPKPDPRAGLHAALEGIGNIPVGSGNDVELLIDGAETFPAIFEAIERAEKYVLVQFYIINDDGIGRQLRDVLIDRARAGVKVRLIYDAVGCAKLPASYLQALEDAGVEAVNAHARGGPRNRLQLNFRNHRKTVVVDSEVGFTGGLNMGDEYMGRDPRYGDWRDTHARVTGPLVEQLQLIFAEDWHWATRESIVGALDWNINPAGANKDAVLVATGPGDDFNSGSLYFCSLINAARTRLWIASPYFVPDTDILTALKLAALRGVDVKLLTPKVADHKIPWLAALAYFDEVMAAGVEVWRYEAGFMHQKVVLVDDEITSVGTLNLDNRSCRLNFEQTVVVFDTEVAARAEAMLRADLDRSFQLTETLRQRPLAQRLGAPFARLLSPLL